MGHQCFGTIHLVIGLFSLNGYEAEILRSLNLSLETVQRHLGNLPTQEAGLELPIPFDNEVKKVLVQATEATRNTNGRIVFARHILFSLLENHQCAAACFLRRFGIDSVSVREKMIERDLRASKVKECSRKGSKIAYPTRHDALIALARLRHRKDDRGEERAYECDSCHQWHLTSKSGKDTWDDVLDFRGANLSNESLRERDLAFGRFRRANLSNIDLSGSGLSHGDFREANLSGASLVGANLEKADFRGAILRGADLSGANLTGAQLDGCDLSGANIIGCTTDGANLEAAIGLPKP